MQVDQIFKEFSGRFNGKQSPHQHFWHSFDLALTRFLGRHAPEREGADRVTREAYSHEVISFCFRLRGGLFAGLFLGHLTVKRTTEKCDTKTRLTISANREQLLEAMDAWASKELGATAVS